MSNMFDTAPERLHRTEDRRFNFFSVEKFNFSAVPIGLH